MLNALPDLHRSQQLMHDADRLMHRVHMRLAQSEQLIARGEARAVARTRTAVPSDETCHEGTIAHTSACPSL
jgi:hypothetical protein